MSDRWREASHRAEEARVAWREARDRCREVRRQILQADDPQGAAAGLWAALVVCRAEADDAWAELSNRRAEADDAWAALEACRRALAGRSAEAAAN